MRKQARPRVFSDPSGLASNTGPRKNGGGGRLKQDDRYVVLYTRLVLSYLVRLPDLSALARDLTRDLQTGI